jgi:hypothetical protein
MKASPMGLDVADELVETSTTYKQQIYYQDKWTNSGPLSSAQSIESHNE